MGQFDNYIVSGEALERTLEELKGVTDEIKGEIGGINSVLDEINGEVV